MGIENLIKMCQVEGLEDLRSLVLALQNQYLANRVYTSIVKTPGNPDEYYTVDEYLTTRIDTLLNDYVKDKVRIYATLYPAGLKNESGKDMETLVENEQYRSPIYPVENGSQTLYRDGVEVEIDEYTFDYVTGIVVLDTPTAGVYTIDFTHILTAPILEFDPEIPEEIDVKIDKTLNYNVYYTNNLPVINETGDNVKYNFVSGFNSTPSLRDPDDDEYLDLIDYIPLTNAVNVKIYPIGRFEWNELNEEYLIDNDEFNLIGHQQLIDDIYVKLKWCMKQHTGGTGEEPSEVKYTLGEDMGPYEVAVLINNLLYQADATVDEHAENVFCFTTEGGLMGDEVSVKRSGTLTNTSWNWVAGDPLFVSTTPGQPTQTIPTNPPFLYAHIVAEVLTPTQIDITIKVEQPVMLLPD